MKIIATVEGLNRLNQYELTEYEVLQEFNSRLKAKEEDDIGQIVLNWKNEDVVILPLGKKTAIVFQYGQELVGTYENLPQIEYKNGKWKFK